MLSEIRGKSTAAHKVSEELVISRVALLLKVLPQFPLQLLLVAFAY